MRVGPVCEAPCKSWRAFFPSADGGGERGTADRGADRSSAAHRHKHPPPGARGRAAAECQRRRGDGRGGPRVEERLLESKAQRPFPTQSEDCLFDFTFYPNRPDFPASWVNHKNNLKRNPCASVRTNMVDWLSLSGQRAEERRRESKRTVTGELSVVKIFLLWPLPWLWEGLCTQLVKYLPWL